MKQHVSALAPLLLVTGCSSDDSSGNPVPTPSPTPTATPIPSPTPSPSPSPAATPASYITFADIYALRLGAGITLPSGCSGFAFSSQPPAIVPATPVGQGLSFRHVLTPGVWAVSGEVGVGFDGRNADPTATDVEVAYAKIVGTDTFRFSITRPSANGAGLDYVRLASVSAPVQGVSRQYGCAVGISTLGSDLATSLTGPYQLRVVLATAHVRDGSATRTYSLSHSTLSLAADQAARRVTISLRMTGSPTGGSGPDLDLGTYAASAPIDPVNGNFVAQFTSSDRTVTGSVSGRFFGPQAVEIGAVIAGSVAASGTASDFSFAGAIFGGR